MGTPLPKAPSPAVPETCDRCEGEGLVTVGHLPNGDVDQDVCDDCDGDGVVS